LTVAAQAPRFDDKALNRVRQALKEFHRGMKKLGVHPRYDVSGDEIVIVIPLDDIIRILRNTVESAVKGYVHSMVTREDGYMVVRFKP